MMRLVDMQIWPWWRNLPMVAAPAVWSRSAAARITRGWLAPESGADRFMGLPPTGVAPEVLTAGGEPVKEIREGTGDSTKWSPISEPEPTTTLSAPAGRPADSKILANSKPPDRGVSEAG